jgi:hypothetical protein
MQVRDQGGAPTLSFGGQANTELAVSCTSVPALTQAYQGVLQRYRDPADHIDDGRQSGEQSLSGLAVRRGLSGRPHGRLASRDL